MEEYIDRVLRQEISDKIKKIEDHSEFYNKRKECISRELREIGDIYSFWVENPGLRKSLLGNKSSRTVKKLARKGIQNINNAWCYLNNPNLQENFIKKLSENDYRVIKAVNSLTLGGCAKNYQTFRNSPVTLNCPDYTPPGRTEEIQRYLKETNLRILETYLKDPLTAAIMWHLEGSAIQPFIEGNKRTFRLIQDKILAENGIPPAIIPAGEGRYYHDIFCQALPAYVTGDIQGQQVFYNYCASKINNGLDDILGDLGVPSKCPGI